MKLSSYYKDQSDSASSNSNASADAGSENPYAYDDQNPFADVDLTPIKIDKRRGSGS